MIVLMYEPVWVTSSPDSNDKMNVTPSDKDIVNPKAAPKSDENLSIKMGLKEAHLIAIPIPRTGIVTKGETTRAIMSPVH